MSNPTYIKLTGWVTKDPELRLTNATGTPVCTVRVGAASRWPDKSTGEWKEGPASYFDVVCWRGLAENVAASLRKGNMVTIHGTFRSRTWIDKDNNTRTDFEITANSVGHELLYGWSHYVRTQRASSRAAEEVADGEARRGLASGAGVEPGEGYQPGQGEGPARAQESAQPEQNPFDDIPDTDGDGEGGADDGGTSEAAESDAGLGEAAVPV